MALVSEISTQSPHRGGGLCGLVVRCTPHRERTYLDVADETGIRTVCVDAVPDDLGAQRLLTRFKHVHSVRVDVGELGVRCQVRGVGHRQPVRQPVPTGLALGLVRQGVPAFAVGLSVVGVDPEAEA